MKHSENVRTKFTEKMGIKNTETNTKFNTNNIKHAVICNEIYLKKTIHGMQTAGFAI